ncbi:hypothetical protein CORC01_00341 [Colletotrichum orchidophilum]|uniref:Uncharacterized protein n=1 Tax=Colletotrichum orchidophilum TaxID=1209926 RepID=A0A1G4BST7_9PEZI|nr:uncharacterized protein CORC01_00341 [Colletotrichum orchidophilum]OHF04489.1 hypothetical protein CORC01_00341 [Colletotrichum orchidophilum]
MCPDVTLDARPLTSWSSVGRWAWQILTSHMPYPPFRPFCSATM